MGQALLDGWMSAASLSPKDVLVATRSSGQRLHTKYGVRAATVKDVVESAETVIVAVKPQYFADVLRGSMLSADQTLLSVMAGIETNTLKQYNPAGAVVRVMPNLASAINCGATVGFCIEATPLDIVQSVQSLFESVGAFAWLENEDQFHPGTALVGSGPAFMFRAMAAFVEAGRGLGLEEDMCSELAIAMVRGSARLAERSPLGLEALCESVASPGGTTVAGLNALSAHQFEAVIARAVEAAASRSKELADEGSRK